MPVDLRVLSGMDFEEIHRAFNDAFSDYVVPLSPSVDQLREMVTRRGWRPELSVGAFEGGKLVGFVFNALEADAGYNSGTGVVPASRRDHVAWQMMERSADLLRRAGAKRYLLEVIDSNAGARRLYERLGFSSKRHLQCWTGDWTTTDPVSTIAQPDWNRLQAMWDVGPSWQNSLESIRRSRAESVVIGDERGYAVVFPATGDLAQLAVAKTSRRRGLGRRLLESAGSVSRKALRIMNIDSCDEGITRFLEACGARRTIAQFEMMLAL